MAKRATNNRKSLAIAVPSPEDPAAKELRGFLKDEYLLLQAQYEDYDRRTLTIKGWVGAGAITALTVAFAVKPEFALLVPLYVIGLTIVFWYLETKWKQFQYAIQGRLIAIEAFFRGEPAAADDEGEEFIDTPFQVFSGWFESYGEVSFIDAGSQLFVSILYIAVMGFSVVTFIVLLSSHLSFKS
jgi:hypothetical protein